ncbi:hypothetical protein WN943_027523 [Citrus x changshan-huyou]
MYFMYFFTWHTYIRNRLNRVAGNGYWKETGGNDIQIGSKGNPIGYKKTLVYYQFQGNYSKGDATKSVFYQYQYQYQGNYSEKDAMRTSWIMQEYRINDQHVPPAPYTQREANLMKNNKWLLCKIYKQQTEFENGDELDTNVCSINTDMDTGSTGFSIPNPSASSKRGEIECNCCAALCLMCKQLRLGCAADEEEDAFTQMENL